MQRSSRVVTPLACPASRSNRFRSASGAPPLIADVRSHLDWSVVNRGAFLLRYKEPALRWINDADPYPRGHTLVLDEVNEERTVYLIADIR